MKFSNGPDAQVYLVAAPDANATVTHAGIVSLGALKENKGDQNLCLAPEESRCFTLLCAHDKVHTTNVTGMKDINDAGTHVFRRKTPRPGGSGWDSIGACGVLPPEMINQAIRRLGWVALFYTLSHPIMRLLFFITSPADGLRTSMFPLLDIAVIGAVSTGILISVMAWSGKLPPALMLDLALLFEVVGAFWIGLAESSMPQNLGTPLRGVSTISLWITIFVLVVPATLGKTILAALGSALMGPVGLLIGILYYRLPVYPLKVWSQLYIPSFVFATWAIVLSRFIYQLGCEVSQERAMGSYKLVELLGAGGMGEVWRAQHRMLARPSALKLIRPDICLQDDREAGTLRRRFEREVQATAMLRSPHTIAVYDFGTSVDGCFYYVMEFLDGFDLEKLVKRFGPIPAERAVYFLLQVCDSLAEAHLNGLIHRDIKPKNIFVSRLGLSYDFIKVLDFGLVKSSAPSETNSQVTIAGTTTGTPAYMAPEIALGKKDTDGRADIYSLGCVAYWLITGQLVFDDPGGSMPVLLAHIQTPPVPPSQRTELDIPAALEAIVLSCLEKDPNRRPQTATELAARLSACKLENAWNSQCAEEWWRTHMPSMAFQSVGQLQAAGS